MQMRKVELGTFDCGACQVAFTEKAIRFYTDEAPRFQPMGYHEQIELEMPALANIQIDKQRGLMCVTGFFGYDVPGHYGPFAARDSPQSRALFHFNISEGDGVWSGSDRDKLVKSLMRLSPDIRSKTHFNPGRIDFAAELQRFKRRASRDGLISPVSLTPQAAAARPAAAAGKQSAAEASTSATDAAPEEPLRVQTVTGRAVLVPLAAGMTAAGLKQELQRGGEGPVEQFRLLHAGKELVDQLPLQLQKVRPGVTIDLALKHVPFKRLPPSQGSSSLSLHLSAEKVAAEKVAAEKAAAAHAKASQEAAQSTSSDAPASAASVSAGAAASASAGAAASRPTVASAEGDGAARACSPLIGAVAQLEAMGAQLVAAGHIDAALRDRFTQLADALRGHDEEDAKRNANGKASADGEQPSAKRPRQGAE